MARPKKMVDELRVHQVNMRLTNSEQIFAQQQAELSGQTIANWLRIAAFSKNALRLKVSPLNRAYYIELHKIGVNLNQIAHRVNSNVHTKIIDEIAQARKLLEQINKLLINDSQDD